MPSASRLTKIPIVYISYRQYRRIDLSLRMLRRDYPRNDASYLSVRIYIYIYVCMYIYRNMLNIDQRNVTSKILLIFFELPCTYLRNLFIVTTHTCNRDYIVVKVCNRKYSYHNRTRTFVQLYDRN